MSKETTPVIHITSLTPLLPVIRSWEIYLQDQGRSQHTVKAFSGDLQLLASYLPPDQTIGAITTNDLNHYLNWLQNGRGVSCSPKSLSRRITSIKSFFRWLNKNAAILVDPAEKVLQQSVISPLPIILTADEQEALITVALKYRQSKKPDARPYTLLKLLLEIGIKKGECLTITPNHLELNSLAGPFLFIRYNNPAYRYKERKLPLSQDWVEAYQEYRNQYEVTDRVFPWSPRRLEYLLEDMGTEAGLSKHVSFDMCRWTSALNDWKAGVESDKIRQKLGISKIQWREISLKLKHLAENAT
ncbi:MAG: site-specific integrase [Anaerolineaceae bacterium]|nr:site-specific integrase [Anaerolineaceae bacterium]